MTAQIVLTICDLRHDCIKAVRARFAGISDFNAVIGDLTRQRTEAWATAGNSFGDMGGGVDKAIDDYYSGAAQDGVRSEIKHAFFNELPVGAAVVVRPLVHKPALIYAPTMRVPGSISGTINAYLAMRAVFIAALREGIRTVACPLFGTGVGGLMPDDAADQMFQAYRLIVLGEFVSVVYSLQAPYGMR